MKRLKSILSIFLAVLLASIMVVPAFAAATEEMSEEDCAPVIQVRGIGEALYQGSVSDANEVFSTNKIVGAIVSHMDALMQFLSTEDTALFVDAAEAIVKDIFKPVMYDNNAYRSSTIVVKNSAAPVEDYMDFSGEMTNEETLAKALYDELGEDMVYFFTYDWTANPFEVATQLDAFIDEILASEAHAGVHDKVSINAESMGGAITNIYINMYGDDKIDNIVMANSAFNGLEMLGQLFIGNAQIDAEALSFLITQEILGNAEFEDLREFIPALERIILMANDIMTAEKESIYADIITPVFGFMPSFWALVPANYYVDGVEKSYFDDAQAFLFDYMTTDPQTNEPVKACKAGENLKTIITAIKAVSENSDDTVQKLLDRKDGNYFNVTNYNRYIAPVTPSAHWNSDGVIEVLNASGFAISAPIGYTLGEDYKQAVDIKGVDGENVFVSPDNVIDASTCQAPFNTWFIKNLGHVSYGISDKTAAFYVWLLTAPTGTDINSNKAYPQFLYYDTELKLLMTWEKKESFESVIQEGVDSVVPDLPDIDVQLPDITDLPPIDVEGLRDALNMLINGANSLIDSIDLSQLTGLLGSLGGMVGGLGDMLMGLLGSLFGGGSTPETPTTPTTPTTPSTPAETPTDAPAETPTDAPAETPTDAPATTPSTNTWSPVGPTTSHNNLGEIITTTGTIFDGEPVFSNGSTTWIIVFAVAAVITGLLIIKL